MFIRTGWSLRTYGLVVIGTGLAAGIAFLVRETSPGCRDGYVAISATMCEASGGYVAARLLGGFAGINACLLIYYILRRKSRYKKLDRMATEDPDAFRQLVAYELGVEIRLPQYEPDQAIDGVAGWFYDPHLESRLRYWSGDSWTQWISTGEGAATKGREIRDTARGVAQEPDPSPDSSVIQNEEPAEEPTTRSADDLVDELSRLEGLFKSGELSEKSYLAARQALVKMLEVKRDD